MIGVDQAEELARAEGESGEALADYLRAALASETHDWQLAFTIRTDSFPELQRHRRFQDLEARGYDLRALPVFRFNDVVEDPAKRYGVEIDPAMIDALMEDAPKEDALPLLAFAMQRLWRQYGSSGALTEANYHAVGGLTGLIEDAAERALSGIEPEHDVPRSPGRLSQRLDDLAAATFVPPLAEINDQGATIRRVSKWADFSEDQQELLSRFDRWRLVVRKVTEADDGTVEVAHEALFREWGRLKDWLEPERHRLEALRALTVAASAWDRQGRSPTYLAHVDKRLAEAHELAANPRFKERLGPIEIAYLEASQKAERLSRARVRRMKMAVGALAVMLALGGVGWWKQDLVREQYHWRMAMGPSVLTAELEKAKAAKSRSDFKECANACPTMIVVPAGTFMMGSPASEEGRSEDEGPQHEVKIARPFAVSRTEVTFSEWDACVASGACTAVGDNAWGRDDRPVINVSWNDAKQYAAWLSRTTGKKYRLLTEAEWEYAARGGSSARFSFGDAENQLDQYAWYYKNSDSKTQLVAHKKANAFGLFDMHGNVWEWVEDCYVDDYAKAPTDGSTVTETPACRRVVRGGSWGNGPQVLRSAGRDRGTTDYRSFVLGFRVARTLNP